METKLLWKNKYEMRKNGDRRVTLMYLLHISNLNRFNNNGLVYLAHLNNCFIINFLLLRDSSPCKQPYMAMNSNTCHVLNQLFSILSMIVI